MHRIALPTEYIQVLQRIARNGREDLMNLAESLRLEPARLLHIIRALQHKGLVRVSRQAGSDAWISLSHKGQRAMLRLYPQRRLDPGT